MCRAMILYLLTFVKIGIFCIILFYNTKGNLSYILSSFILKVQLSDRIVIYKLVNNEGTSYYKQVNKIIKQFDCNLLVVCMLNIILCQVIVVSICFCFQTNNIFNKLFWYGIKTLASIEFLAILSGYFISIQSIFVFILLR